MAESDLDKRLTHIAKEHLLIDTLKTRKSDSLDFHDVSVWGVKSALETAYEAGRMDTLAEQPTPFEKYGRSVEAGHEPQRAHDTDHER